jgi:hypothetical protein
LRLARNDTAGDVWLNVDPVLTTGVDLVSLRCEDVDALAAPPVGYTEVFGVVALADDPIARCGQFGRPDGHPEGRRRPRTVGAPPPPSLKQRVVA